jgi:hypothetical protein
MFSGKTEQGCSRSKIKRFIYGNKKAFVTGNPAAKADSILLFMLQKVRQTVFSDGVAGSDFFEHIIIKESR